MNSNKFCILAVIAVLLLPLSALAWPGRVVAISDGDTMTVLRDNVPVKIRIYGIDAPERRQAWGDRAKQALGELTHGQTVEIQEMGRDRYCRTVASVVAQGQDIGLKMIRMGLAWVYPRYCRASACEEMRQTQAEAQAARAGLWADPDQMPPWEWRHR